jgi:hypothetical protein
MIVSVLGAMLAVFLGWIIFQSRKMGKMEKMGEKGQKH